MRKLLLCLALAASSSSLLASTTFQIEIQEAYAVGGSHVAAGTIGILVADANGDNSFAGSSAGTYASIVGTVLNVGQSIGGDKIVGLIQAADLGGGGPFGFSDVVSVANTGGVTTNTKLGFYWFPGITSVGATLQNSQSQMGFYTNPSPADGGVAFAMPGTDSGATLNLLATSVSSGGTTPNASLTAFSLSATPEPSRALLLGVGSLGLLVRRRRRHA